MKKKTLSSLKVSEITVDNMKNAIKKYNNKNLTQFTENSFRRLSIELLAQMILQDLKIPVKLQ